MLQNLKFDLLKLRSSGIGSAIEDVTSATQEARALSRDIGHVLEAGGRPEERIRSTGACSTSSADAAGPLDRVRDLLAALLPA